MKIQLATGLRRAWSKIPPISPILKLCRMYTNFYSGEFNSDFRTNGEGLILRAILPKCNTVFDVGANVGDWTELALSINPALKIHCFEPSTATFSSLVANVGNRAQLNRMALSSTRGEAKLHLHGAASDVNSLHFGGTGGIGVESGVETVPLDTFDAYCEIHGIESVDFVKIDTEGHEFSVLEGMTNMLGRRAIEYVQLEYGAGYLAAGKFFRDVYELLQSNGYNCSKITPRALIPLLDYKPEIENFSLSNWLFQRRRT